MMPWRLLAAYSLFSQASAMGQTRDVQLVVEIPGNNEENVRARWRRSHAVLNNGYRDGKVVVEVDLIQATKEKALGESSSWEE